jgi:hypothetical protein
VKAVAIILIVLVLAGGAAYIAALLTGASNELSQRFRGRKNQKTPWELEEKSDGELVVIYACKPGEERLMIGAVPFSSQDFDMKLYELRAEGQEKVMALNQRTLTR